MWSLFGAYYALKLGFPPQCPYFIHAVSQQVLVECLFSMSPWTGPGDLKSQTQAVHKTTHPSGESKVV